MRNSSERRRRPQAVAERPRSTAERGPDTELPLFAYGLLSGAELGFWQIRNFVESAVEGVSISGALYIRDGLPLVVLEGGPGVTGTLITFNAADRERAYAAIRRLEPERLYRWEIVRTDGGEKANVLVGRDPMRGGSAYFDEPRWRSAEDPVFVEGLSVVRRETIRLFGEYFAGELRPYEEYFRLQAQFLLLGEIVERFAVFTIGVGVEGLTERVSSLESLPDFPASFDAARVERVDPVYDIRNLQAEPITFDRKGRQAWATWYRVRSNLTHRGKAADRDWELVKRSHIGMHDVLRQLLLRMQPGIAHSWRRSDPNGEPDEWALWRAVALEFERTFGRRLMRETF